jgi:hypothetical protein
MFRNRSRELRKGDEEEKALGVEGRNGLCREREREREKDDKVRGFMFTGDWNGMRMTTAVDGEADLRVFCSYEGAV